MFRYSTGITKNVLINTGNILNIREVKRKAGQNTSEELVESIVHACKKSVVDSEPEEPDGEEVLVNDNNEADALQLNVHEERKAMKVSVKIFVASYEPELLKEALDAVLGYLNTPYIESVILASHGGKTTYMERLQNVWTALEDYVINKKVLHIGVTDMESDDFAALYAWAKVKPGIIQINLAHCCVVPPDLQSFAKEHDVTLLTHSDPIHILPETIINEIMLKKEDQETWPLSFAWASRYQVHIKCRGVLSSKGYIVCLKKSDI